MIIEDKNHILFLYKLLNKIKYCEVDEIELIDFINSPFLTELQKNIEKDFKKHFVDNDDRLKELFDNSKLENRHCDLIINRVNNWSNSTKDSIILWTDKEINNYLIQMIEPLKYSNEQLTDLVNKFKVVIQEYRNKGN